MKKQVLVLNQNYSAITVCSMSKAFVLLYLNKAEMVEQAQDLYWHSVKEIFQAPSVIRLVKYVHIPYKSVVLNRQNLLKRDHFQCQYCHRTKELTIDHIIPKSRGGESSWNNLVIACRRCNAHKGDRTPEEAQMPLLSKPGKPSYFWFLSNEADTFFEDWKNYLFTKK